VSARRRQGYRVRVGRSAVHGRGLFAAEDIPADRLVLRARGRRTKRNGPHVLWLVADGVDVGLDIENEARWVNHADEPNAAFYDEELWSLKRIRAGEEITHHYGEGWDLG
jgi:SET domain-containing protein